MAKGKTKTGSLWGCHLLPCVITVCLLSQILSIHLTAFKWKGWFCYQLDFWSELAVVCVFFFFLKIWKIQEFSILKIQKIEKCISKQSCKLSEYIVLSSDHKRCRKYSETRFIFNTVDGQRGKKIRDFKGDPLISERLISFFFHSHSVTASLRDFWVCSLCFLWAAANRWLTLSGEKYH